MENSKKLVISLVRLKRIILELETSLDADPINELTDGNQVVIELSKPIGFIESAIQELSLCKKDLQAVISVIPEKIPPKTEVSMEQKVKKTTFN